MCLGWSMKLVDLELYFASRQCVVAEPARRATESVIAGRLSIVPHTGTHVTVFST